MRTLCNLLLIPLTVISIQAFARDVEGSMDCTVTGNVVVSSEEGKFKTYAGLQGGVSKNENLNLSYSVTSNSIYIALKREQADKNILLGAFLNSNDSQTYAEKGASGGFVLTDSRFNHSVSFLPDYIRINEIREFVISRYYKNDWHGIYSYVSPLDLSTHTLTFNCRHTRDKMADAFKLFNGFKMKK